MAYGSQNLEEQIIESLNYIPEDPLDYHEFDHNKSDWDNVPLIVTKFIIFLSRNFQGLSKKCKHKFSEETTKNVRVDLQQQINKITEDLTEDNKNLMQTQQEFKIKIQDLNQKFHELEETFKESKKFSETMATDNMYDLISIPSRNVDLTSRFPSYNELSKEEKLEKKQLYCGKKMKQGINNPNFEASWMNDDEFSNPKYSRARMFTLNQIRDLIYLHLSRSDLRKKACRHENLVDYHDNAIFDQNRDSRRFQVEVDEKFTNTRELQEKTNTEIQELILRYNKRITDINRTLSTNEKQLFMLREDSDYLQKHLDITKAKTEILDDKIAKVHSYFEGKIAEQNQQIQKEIKKANQYIKSESSRLSNIQKKSKELLLEVIEINKGTIISDVKEEMENVKMCLETTQEAIEKALKDNSEENQIRVSKIKGICSKYFEKYDKVNIAVEKKFEKVNLTFEEWKEKVLKPLNMSEARLYTTEVRIKEVEGKIYSNFAHSKEMFKKLIFALEQENLSHKPSLSASIQNAIAHNTRGSSGDASHSPRNSDMNFIFLKRLLFLKNEINEQSAEGFEPEEIEKNTRIKTPSFHIKKKVSKISTDLFMPKPRMGTVSVKHRKKSLRSTSPIKMFKSKDFQSKNNSKIKLDIFKKSIYGGAQILGKSFLDKNPKHAQSLSMHIDQIRKEATKSYDLKDISSQILG
ncbi:unnamed protein product [Moneuplotes crassus]|uniref:Uncharacterized protein n=1 Tax=Euplotes crassus TaxID=5936 RepID=A0AAD1Y951_EUPCR|nr:unnamed protein product [Moneuplotes crassus]